MAFSSKLSIFVLAGLVPAIHAVGFRYAVMASHEADAVCAPPIAGGTAKTGKMTRSYGPAPASAARSRTCPENSTPSARIGSPAAASASAVQVLQV